ncbi:MAG TPA: type II toxin-antitoxin system VapC family toxin, partial [Solirubrobacteraceae bacterium]
MREVVLDASVVLKWFHTEGEENVEAARRVRGEFENGRLQVLAPPLLWLEIINVAARRWRWEPTRLTRMSTVLPDLGFVLAEPALAGVVRWAGKGLTAYDAVHVAVAETAQIELITDDFEIQRVAPDL